MQHILIDRLFQKDCKKIIPHFAGHCIRTARTYSINIFAHVKFSDLFLTSFLYKL